MKQCILSLFIVLLVMFSTNAKAQQVSSRTGQPVQKTIVSWAQFNDLPAQIQVIIKNNPQKFVIQGPTSTVSISTTNFNKLPQEEKDFILAHPEKYTIETTENQPLNNSSN